MRSRSASTTAMGTGVYMPCYNLLWGLHVPYLFLLYLGVNWCLIESSGGWLKVALERISFRRNHHSYVSSPANGSGRELPIGTARGRTAVGRPSERAWPCARLNRTFCLGAAACGQLFHFLR